MGPLLRWSWLLGVALMAPADLPAGGAERRQPQIRRRAGSGPLHTPAETALQLSPLSVAPRLRPLRRWTDADGQAWLQVQTLSGDPQRGWIRI